MNLKLNVKQKTRLAIYYPNISMAIIINTENRKVNESYKLFLNLKQILDLRSSNKYVAFQNQSIYYTWKNIGQHYICNKLKIIAPMWNDEFELPWISNGSYSISNVHDYIKDVIRKLKLLPTNPPINIYINKINNRLGVKINIDLS